MSRFHLTISGDRPDYQVNAQAPDGGEQSGPLRLPEAATLDRLLRDVQHAVIASTRQVRWHPNQYEAKVQALGKMLYSALPDRVSVLLYEWAGRAEAARERLQVVLQVDPPELARLPWEQLCHPEQGDYFFLYHHLIRHMPVIRPEQATTRTRQALRVLAMIGYADGLNAELERTLLAEALAQPLRERRVTLTWVEGPTWEHLREEVESREYHIFHFIGHGYYDEAAHEGGIVLSDGDGGAHSFDARRLALVLRGKPSLRLVVLNACDAAVADQHDRFSSVAGALIRQGVSAVVAMQFEITDEAARVFSSSYYRALAEPHPVELAVTRAREELFSPRQSLEWSTPVLYMRSPGEPVFEVWRPARAASITAGMPVTAVAFSPHNTVLTLACQGVDGPLPVAVEDWELAPPEPTWGQRLLAWMFSPELYDLSYHPEDGRLAGAGADYTARIWEQPSGRVHRRLRHPDEVLAVAYHPASGEVLATGCRDGVVRRWAASDGSYRQLAPLRHSGPVWGVAWDPAGKQLATACDDHSATIWEELDSPEPSRQVFPHPAPVWAVAVGRHGHLATGCADGVARVWNKPDPKRSPRQFPHGGPVRAVAFSPDGELLATACEDGTARAWEVSTDVQVLAVRHAAPVRALAFSPDGHWLATASDDGTSQVRQLKDPEVVQMFYDGRVPEEEAEELRDLLGELGFATRMVREPVRRGFEQPTWWVLLQVPLDPFVAALMAIAAAGAVAKIGDWVARRRGRHTSGEEQPTSSGDVQPISAIMIRDLRYPGVWIGWDPSLPPSAYSELAAMDLSKHPEGTIVQYVPLLGRWHARPPA